MEPGMMSLIFVSVIAIGGSIVFELQERARKRQRKGSSPK